MFSPTLAKHTHTQNKVGMGKIIEEDQFNRLPNDLILIILTKIKEAKFMCSISMVSTRFYDLTLQSKSLTITIPTNPNPPKTHSFFQKFFNFCEGPLQHLLPNQSPQFLAPFLDYPIHSIFTPSYIHSLIKFLDKFESLEVLTVTTPSTNNNASSILDWTAIFKPYEILQFVVRIGVKEAAFTSDDVYVDLGRNKMMEVLMGYQCVVSIVSNSSNMKRLKWVEISDPHCGGRIVLDDSLIGEMKNVKLELKGFPTIQNRSWGLEDNVLGSVARDGDTNFKKFKNVVFRALRISQRKIDVEECRMVKACKAFQFDDVFS